MFLLTAVGCGSGTEVATPVTSTPVTSTIVIPTTTALPATTVPLTSALPATTNSPTASTSSTTVASLVAFVEIEGERIVEIIDSLEVNDAVPDSNYDRDDWGSSWSDDDDDCINTRHEVLLSESIAGTTLDSSACTVIGGRWFAAFTGTYVNDPSALDIDHFVPLANAHASGGWAWSTDTKRNYYNDLTNPQHLIAVTASTNRSKGAKGPDEWKPPDETYWCQYAHTWADIKVRWGLTVTSIEMIALQTMLEDCDAIFGGATTTTTATGTASPTTALLQPTTSVAGTDGHSGGSGIGRTRPVDRYVCNIDSLGYCIFTGTPHQTGLDPGTDDIVDRDGNFLFPVAEAVAVNAQGNLLPARGTPAFDGDDLQRSPQDGLSEDEKAFHRVMAVMFPIRNALMYDIAELTQTKWDLLVDELKRRDIKETTSISGPTPKDNYYGRQGIFDLTRGPGGRDIHHDVMKFLEEAGLYLLCHVTTSDFGEMLRETHPEGHDPCTEAGISVKIPFPD